MYCFFFLFINRSLLLSSNVVTIFLMDFSGFQFIESMLSSHTPEAENAVIAFSKHFASYPLNHETAFVYQKLIYYNNSEIIDVIFKTRNPDSFFSILEPSRSLMVFAFSTLTDYRAGELYKPAILSCLGIIQNAYKNPGFGVEIYPLSVSDLYHTAKYLKMDNDEVETHIIDFFENLCSLSKYENITALARNIIDAHYDNSKKLESVIPLSILL